MPMLEKIEKLMEEGKWEDPIVIKAKDYILNSKEYEMYISTQNKKIAEEFLNQMKNTPYKEKIQLELANIIPLDQKRSFEKSNEEAKEQAILRSLQRKNSHLGYIHASAYIFVIVNLGLFLSILLLMLK